MQIDGLKRAASALLVGLVSLVAACGGGSDGGGQQQAAIGAAGGTVNGSNGAQVVIPAGALAASTPIAVEQSSSGAPALPSGFASFGQVFAFTPHGTTFAMPVTVSVPFDPAQLPAGATPVLYKTNAQGAWEAVTGATINAGTVSAQVSSFSFFLLGNLPPQITRQPADQSVLEGQAATFSVTALGTPPFNYQWQRSDDGGATFANIAGATTGSFTTPAATAAADNNDRYSVLVGNLEGSSTSQAATLSVTANVVAPAITTQPQDVALSAGGTATFTVIATGTSPLFQWQRSNDGATFSDIAGATNASFTLANAGNADNNARFRARVSNGAGSVTSNAARLTVGAPPPPSTGQFTLTVSLSGNFGEVWGFDAPNQVVPRLQCINSPGGPNPCSERYRAGTQVRLVPQTFTGQVVWTGCDQDNGNDGCVVVVNSDRSVTARFQ